MSEDYTRVLEPEGSWTNHQVAERNRRLQVGSVIANYREKKKLPPLYVTRIVITLVMIPLLLGLVLSSSLAHWAQKSIVEDTGFELVTTDMMNDSDLQGQLKTAVVNDVMSNSSVTDIVGDGNSSGILGGMKNWAHDQLESTVNSTADSVFSSADYPQIWQQVMEASHTYNMNNPDVAGIDIAPIFNAMDAKIGTIFGYDPDLTKTTFIVPIESTNNNVVAQNITVLKNYGATWKAQIAATIIFAILMFLVAPTRRLWWTSGVAALGALVVWIVSTLVGQFTLPNFGSETARVLANGLTDALKNSLSSHLVTTSTWLVAITVIAFLLGLIVAVIKLGTKKSAGRLQGLLSGLA